MTRNQKTVDRDGWGELRTVCVECGAPVVVCGYVGDLEPGEPYRDLDCRSKLQDERDAERATRARSPFQVPERARTAYNEFPEGY